eukprot:SAG31_NODE_1594_length_7791_cov_2.912192_7_plen_146_part_00
MVPRGCGPTAVQRAGGEQRRARGGARAGTAGANRGAASGPRQLELKPNADNASEPSADGECLRHAHAVDTRWVGLPIHGGGNDALGTADCGAGQQSAQIENQEVCRTSFAHLCSGTRHQSLALRALFDGTASHAESGPRLTLSSR